MDQTVPEKEAIRRSYLLSGSPGRVLFSLAFPLVLYNTVSQSLTFFDIFIASRLDPGAVSSVAFVSQIQNMFAALGAGLAIGGGILIARAFGAGDMALVRRRISTLILLSLGLALLLLGIFLPLAAPFLRLLRMPPELLGRSTLYFRLETVLVVSLFINSIFFASEKARGKTAIVLGGTLMVLAVKTILSSLLVLVFHRGLLALSAASLTAHGSLTLLALARLTGRSNPYRLSLREADFSAAGLGPLLRLAVPVFLEKFAFSFGKVIVNSMSASYGSSVVGALGISNRISSIATTPPLGIQDAEASLISQNLGAGQRERALKIFRFTFLVNLILGTVLFLAMTLAMEPLITLFSRGDAGFALDIRKIYNLERYATILLAASSSVMGLLYGFGWTRTAMVLNMARLFLFRIPPLWIIIRMTSLGSEGVGLAMLISNVLVGISAILAALLLLRRLKNRTPAEEGLI